jgi:hypothetical protein
MATVQFSCGCAVTASMFGERVVLSIILCEDHAGDEKLAALMCQAAERVHELHPPTEVNVGGLGE